MLYIATIILILMTLVLTTSGGILWKHRNETGDYSRHIQAIFSLVSAFFTLTFVFRTWAGTTIADDPYFTPEHTFIPLLVQMCYFLYPLEVIRPSVSRTKVYATLFLPLLLLVLIGMCTGIEYTTIYTHADLWAHIGEFNVWFRLLAIFIMLTFSFSLFLIPYDWRKSSANKKFISLYSFGFCLIGIVHFCTQLTHSYWLVITHQLVWIGSFIFVAWYELKERLSVSQTIVTEKVKKAPSASPDQTIWMRICTMLEEEEMWRDPNMTLSSLSEQLHSNRTYVGEAFKQNTGMTFVEYIAHCRIKYVVETLKTNPETNVKELFNYVGYRQRSTAWRNFQKIMGQTPSEFVDSLHNNH